MAKSEFGILVRLYEPSLVLIAITPLRRNIHDGIDSAILILKHRLKASETHPEIQVIKEYAQIPLVECFAS